MKYIYHDGGREAAGYSGKASDCVCRSIAIASGIDYQEIYDRLAEGNAMQRGPSRGRTARNGIITQRQWFKDYMAWLGFEWTPTMKVGRGCTVHLRAEELPRGRLVVAVSKHYTAVIDGIIHDTHDCSRGGTRCVYGYWTWKGEAHA